MKHKKLLSGIIGLFIVAAMSFCSQKKDNASTTENKQSYSNPDGINPNGSSELAILMRGLTQKAEETHQALKNKSDIPPLWADSKQILTAKPTDSNLNKTLFDPFAKHYLNTLQNLYDSPENERITNFNIMVNGCITCHENFCHGPIKRIRKLLLAEIE
ncbi:MAG: hypothetical protein AABZ32_08060 [Bacteroidota bacterium]